MLVCSNPSDEVNKCLRATGCEVIRVNDGETAIAQVRHAIFDVAVLVSTGEAMDLAETVFNLRDISRSMQIIIISDPHGTEEGAPVEIIAHASPNTRALTVDELATFLGMSGSSPR